MLALAPESFCWIVCCYQSRKQVQYTSVAEPHIFYAVPVPRKNFDAAPAPAPTLLYRRLKILKGM
jgi:hypothetical protein